MVVIGRGTGEILDDTSPIDVQPQADVDFAESDVVIALASRIADRNSELMRRLA